MSPVERWRFYMQVYGVIRSGDIDMANPASSAERAGRWADACCAEEDKRFGVSEYREDKSLVEAANPRNGGGPYR